MNERLTYPIDWITKSSKTKFNGRNKNFMVLGHKIFTISKIDVYLNV